MTNGKFASDILTEPTWVAVSNSLATGRCYNLKIINAVPVNNKWCQISVIWFRTSQFIKFFFKSCEIIIENRLNFFYHQVDMRTVISKTIKWALLINVVNIPGCLIRKLTVDGIVGKLIGLYKIELTKHIGIGANKQCKEYFLKYLLLSYPRIYCRINPFNSFFNDFFFPI